MYEITPSTAMSLGMKPEVARRRILAFRDRYSDAYLYLAFHAAFPLVLTPDLLYRLRANFQRDVHNEELNIPWIAVADLLLSRLCNEVGYELYEMDVAIRAELLSQLKSHPRFGIQRIYDLSNFLRTFVKHQLSNPSPAIRKFAQAQDWMALAATKPDEAARSIALTLSKLSPDDRAEFARMASLIEAFIDPPDELARLLIYARGMEFYASGDEESAKAELSKATAQWQAIEVQGVSLSVPSQVRGEVKRKQERKRQKPLKSTVTPPHPSLNVHFRIQQYGRGYQAYIQTDYSDWYSFDIQLTTEDVKELNAELQQAIEQVSRYFEAKNVDLAERAEALSRLAQIGTFAFRKIFAKGTSRDIVQEALTTNAVINVTSEDFFIPWELLFDGSLGEDLDISHFWGMRHIVSRGLIREARPGDFTPAIIQSSRPRVGLISLRELRHVVSTEIPYLQRIDQQKNISLMSLRSLNAAKRNEELERVGRFLQEDLQIIHFACATHEKESLHESYLLVSDNFAITMEDFLVKDFVFRSSPLVILNASIGLLQSYNWAALFWKCGARGVLTAEFHVPDSFAATFTEILYTQFLSGKPIGEALLATRHYFWEMERNPLGLGYALYASPALRMVGEKKSPPLKKSSQK